MLQLIVEGKATTEMAELLSLSPNTVDTYRSRLMQKLGVSDLPSLVKFAIRHRDPPRDAGGFPRGRTQTRQIDRFLVYLTYRFIHQLMKTVAWRTRDCYTYNTSSK